MIFSRKLVGFLSPVLTLGIVAAVGGVNLPAAQNVSGIGGTTYQIMNLPGPGCPCLKRTQTLGCPLFFTACTGWLPVCIAGTPATGNGNQAGTCTWDPNNNPCSGGSGANPLCAQLDGGTCN
jgi:hypothetical protein